MWRASSTPLIASDRLVAVFDFSPGTSKMVSLVFPHDSKRRSHPTRLWHFGCHRTFMSHASRTRRIGRIHDLLTVLPTLGFFFNYLFTPNVIYDTCHGWFDAAIPENCILHSFLILSRSNYISYVAVLTFNLWHSRFRCFRLYRDYWYLPYTIALEKRGVSWR